MNNSKEYINTLQNAAKGFEAMALDITANFKKSFGGKKEDIEALENALGSANVKAKVIDIMAQITDSNKPK